MNQIKTEDTTTEEVKKEIPKNTTDQETPEQINWRKFRETREQERVSSQKGIEEEKKKTKAAQDQAQAFKDALDSVMNKETPQQSAVAEPLSDFGSLDMPTGKEVMEYTQKSINEGIQKGLEKYVMEQQRVQKEKEQQNLPKRLKESHENFDKICSQENLDYLEYHYPEVAVPFSKMKDDFSKWSNIYKAIKRFVPTPDAKADKDKIDKNLNRPQSASAVSINADSDNSKGVSMNKRQQNWQRMQKIMKGM